MAKTFHNTVGLSGNELKEAVAKALKQEEAILTIFLNTRRPFTASEITRLTEKAGHKWPLWSNRRAVTNLMNSSDLTKTAVMQLNPETGGKEHKYAINPVKHPSPQSGVQANLFNNDQKAA